MGFVEWVLPPDFLWLPCLRHEGEKKELLKPLPGIPGWGGGLTGSMETHMSRNPAKNGAYAAFPDCRVIYSRFRTQPEPTEKWVSLGGIMLPACPALQLTLASMV